MSTAKNRGRRSRDTRSAVQRDVDGRGEANRLAWTRRHPELAAAERAIRRGNLQTQDRWKHKNEGTPETHERASRRCQGALARLCQAGAIDAEQLASAAEIAAVAERIGADVAVKTASLEARVDVTRMGDGAFYERLGQVRREMAYTRWRASVRCPAAVLEMLVGDPDGYAAVGARHGMGHRRAKRVLIEALDLWPACLGSAAREVDQAELDRAHARLAA